MDGSLLGQCAVLFSSPDMTTVKFVPDTPVDVDEGRIFMETLPSLQIQQHLQKTRDPIDSIAMQCGWRTPIALKLLFRKRFGMSMRDWRKSH